MADLKLKQEAGDFKISFTNGDFTTTQGLDTALQMSTFCEQRDTSIEVPEQRGGWWGNELHDIEGFEQGSLIWTQYQSNISELEADQAESSLRDSHRWLVEDRIASEVVVNSEVVNNNKITSAVEVLRNNNKEEAQFFDLWENTGK
jgi:phage gp46-like protein